MFANDAYLFYSSKNLKLTFNTVGEEQIKLKRLCQAKYKCFGKLNIPSKLPQLKVNNTIISRINTVKHFRSLDRRKSHKEKT